MIECFWDGSEKREERERDVENEINGYFIGRNITYFDIEKERGEERKVKVHSARTSKEFMQNTFGQNWNLIDHQF